MKRVRALRATSLVRIVGGMITFILVNAGLAPSPARADPTLEIQPALEWGRLYDSYLGFYQLQNVGGSEVVALASTASTGETGQDIHLVKFSASGDILWDRRFGGDYADYANSLTRASDGGFLICGYTSSI